MRYCPPAPDMQMRGAVNAPRPNDPGMQNSKVAGGVVGPRVVADPVKIPTLAEVIYVANDPERQQCPSMNC